MNSLDNNPFADPLLASLRENAPAALDPYRSFFLAKLTAKTSVSGVWNYDWTEQSFDRATGAPTDANPARSGSYSGGALSPALEANNAEVPVGTYVFLKQKGIVNGQTYYEFTAPGTGNGNWKPPARVATTTNGTFSTAFDNGSTVDGVALVTGDRILIKNQTSETENGLYIVAASGAPARAPDADTGAELLGALVIVSEGTVNADTLWFCTADAPITVGSTALPWLNVPTNSGGTDNHVPRYNGAYSLQDSFAQLSDTGDFTVYDVASPVSGSRFAQLRNRNDGINPVVPQLVLAPVGSTSGGTVGFGKRFVITAEDSGGDLSEVNFNVDFDGSSGQRLTVEAANLDYVGLGTACFTWNYEAYGPAQSFTALRANWFVTGDSAFGDAALKVGPTGDGVSPFRYIYLQPAEAAAVTTRMAYAVTDASVLKLGVYGTLAPGMTVSGGIITSAGSGSFASTGANTFTDTQTIASPNAPALVVQQTAGNASHTIEVKNIAGTVTFFVTGNGDVTANSFTGDHIGDGSGLTDLNASALSTGTVPAARLPPGVGIGGGLSLFLVCY